MARKVCQTVPGDSVCCQAAQQGLLGRPITFTTRSGARRCGVCNVRPSMSTDPRKRGMPVFVFRFARNMACGIGPSGCAALGQLSGGQGQMALPAPGTFIGQGGLLPGAGPTLMLPGR